MLATTSAVAGSKRTPAGFSRVGSISLELSPPVPDRKPEGIRDGRPANASEIQENDRY
jgi:hypothetical protein